MRTPALFLAAAVLAGLGFCLGRKYPAPAQPQSVESAPAATAPTATELPERTILRSETPANPEIGSHARFAAESFKRDIHAALWLTDAGERRRQLRDLADHVADADLLVALDDSALPKNLDDRWQFQHSLLERLGRLSPAAALDWTRGLTNTELRNRSVAAVLQGWAATAPIEAANYLISGQTEQLGSNDRAKLVAEFVGRWSQIDSSASTAWARQISDPQQRAIAFEAVVQSLAHADPPAAASLFHELPATKASQSTARELVGRWAGTDPQAAARWSLELPAGEARQNAISTLTHSWPHQDGTSAAWVAALPNGPDRDAAIYGFVNQIDGYNIARATEWAATITDLAIRDDTLRGTVQRWLREDPPAAQKWLSTAPISDEQRNLWLQSGR